METRVKLQYGNRATLPEIAKYIVAEAFPELEGRAVPVTGVDDDKEAGTSIDMPFALLGLRIGDTSGPADVGGNGTINLRDDFVIEFNFKKERYKTRDGKQTSLFSFYDYESVRDRLFAQMEEFSGEFNVTFEYVSIDISTEGDTVYIEFRFRQIYEWCKPVRECDTVIKPGDILGSMCIKDGCACQS